MTRLNYDEVDREIREAIYKGLEDYHETADERAVAVKRDRAASSDGKKSDLRKLAAFGRA